MTTKIPNGYEAVQVPVGCFGIELFVSMEAIGYWLDDKWIIQELPGIRPYCLIGRASELTEKQANKIVDDISYLRPSPYNIDEDEVVDCWIDYRDKTEELVCFSAIESFYSLLASLDLEADTTVIIKKENV